MLARARRKGYNGTWSRAGQGKVGLMRAAVVSSVLFGMFRLVNLALG